ncbi:hypothetical protein N7452_003138 [Penicillium brevicompactum]|uniref:Ysc84 actin-binding domain-containing protein n=1 Tax=Penicillium brevicompactum TaxID=5074 RepID=A0A9W9QUG2_PENBR|nr:hypothetical protein N7452_003138 [Penicillium brevicompactum]
MGGVGAGGQFGAELTDFVFVLTTDAAVKTFMQSGSLTLGGNISMAVGPVGRSAEASGLVGTKGAAGVFAYSKTRGLYGGLTVEGGVLVERADANKKFYGRKIHAKELLTGTVPSPSEAEVLLKVLNGTFFQFGSAESEGQAEPTDSAESADRAGEAESAEVPAPSSEPQNVEPQQSAHSTSEAPSSAAIEHEQQAARDAGANTTDIPTSEPNQQQPAATDEPAHADTAPTEPAPAEPAPAEPTPAEPTPAEASTHPKEISEDHENTQKK